MFKSVYEIISKLSLWIYAGLIVTVLLLNEVITFLISQILNLPYMMFPQSWWFNYEVIKTGNTLAFMFAILSLAWALVFLIGLMGKHTINRIFIAISGGLLIGVIIGNLLFVFLGNGVFSVSPLHFFSLYLMRHTLMGVYWFYISYAIGIGFGFLFALSAAYRMISGNNKIHGDSRWANLFDLFFWKMLSAKDGALYLGRFLGLKVYAFGFECLLLLAPAEVQPISWLFGTVSYKLNTLQTEFNAVRNFRGIILKYVAPKPVSCSIYLFTERKLDMKQQGGQKPI